VRESLRRIEAIWVTLARHEIYVPKDNGKRSRRKLVAVQSRVILVDTRLGEIRLDGGIDPLRFSYRPGDIFSQLLFGPGRQLALLSLKAVQYDPYRQRVEKRLLRYLSWQWRIRAASATYLLPFRVSTLLDAVGADLNRERPLTIRNRLEKALDTLEDDKLIRSWQYTDWNEQAMARRKWADLWLRAKVVIEPPELVQDKYRTLSRPEAGSREKAGGEKNRLGEAIRQRRLQRGISLLIAAQEIGIDYSLLCRIEKGRRNATPRAQTKIDRWLSPN
jgi:hypothetical protein